MLLVCWLSASLETANYTWNGAALTSGWHDTRETTPGYYVNNFGMLGNPLPAFPGTGDDVELGAASAELNSQNVSIHSLSMSGVLMIPSGFAFTVATTITNDGTIRINDNSTSTANLRTNGQTQLLGTGRVVFANPADDDNYITYTSASDRLTIGPGQTITNEEAGTTGHIAVQITNGGLIDADGGTIWLESYAKINNNLLRARNAGVLQIYGVSVDNTLGTITAESNSFVKPGSSATITGGTINGAGLVRMAGTATFANLHLDSATVEIETGDTLNLAGTVVNDGTINIKDIEWSGYAYLNPQGDVNLNGAGKVLFTAIATTGPDSYIGYNAATDRLIVGPNQTIATAGPGTLGHVTVQLTNNGLVDADGGTLSLENYTKINNNLIRARNGGVLKISGCTVNNSAGTITAEANSFIQPESNAVVTGGTINGAGKVKMLSTGTFTNLHIDGGTVEIETDGTLKLAGTIVNDGTIKINDTVWSGYAYLKTQGDVYLNGAGKVLFISPPAGPDSYIAYNATSDSLIVGSSQTIATAGPGTLGHVTVHFINNGVVEADGGTLQLESQPMINQGVFRACNGGIFNILTTLTNYNVATHTLTGGNYEVQAASTLNFGANSPVTINFATITLSGTNSVFAAINSLAENRGTFSVISGRNFTTAGALLNSGDLIVDSGSSLSVKGGLTGAGQTTVMGSSTLTADAISQNVLTIGAGSTVTIRALSGGPLSADFQAVPEPGTLFLLGMAGIGFFISARRNGR